MMVFDFDLNLKEIIHMDYYMGEMVVEGNLIYGICYNAPPAKGFCLVSTAKSRPDTEPDTLLTFQNIVPGRWTFGKSLLSRHDGTYVCFPFDTHIYQFRKGEITETYNMDFGDHGLLAHPLPENITPKMFDRYNNGLHWSIVNMSSSDSLLLFNTNSFELFIMDKEKDCVKDTRKLITTCPASTADESSPRKGFRKASYSNATPIPLRKHYRLGQRKTTCHLS